MTHSEAMTLVAHKYVPGTADFYRSMKPDPWMDAHETLHRVISTGDWELIEMAVTQFVKTCSELIENYARQVGQVPAVKPRDAFEIGDEGLVKQWESLEEKSCSWCETKLNLTFVPKPGDPKRVIVACRACKKWHYSRGAGSTRG